MLLSLALLTAQPVPQAPLKATNHPRITEVLYDVPGRGLGDANRDGKRSAGGDEFVEIANLGTTPVQLVGYKLIDSQAWRTEQEDAEAKKTAAGSSAPTPKDAPKGVRPGSDSKRLRTPADTPGEHVRFVFPALELQPGEVVVVFNGRESTIPGPVGDAKKAEKANDQFTGAYVFTMKITSEYAALGNTGDWIALVAPDGSIVDGVRWGLPDEDPPAGAPVLTAAPGAGSTERVSDSFVPHRPTSDGKPMSPGRVQPAAEPRK